MIDWIKNLFLKLFHRPKVIQPEPISMRERQALDLCAWSDSIPRGYDPRPRILYSTILGEGMGVDPGQRRATPGRSK